MLRRLLGNLLQLAGAALARTDPPPYSTYVAPAKRDVGSVGLTEESEALLRAGLEPDPRPAEELELPLVGSLEARRRDLGAV